MMVFAVRERRTVTAMKDDTISRQAMVDTVDLLNWYHQNKNGEMVLGANSAEHQAWYKAEDIYKAIECVPSAQPEDYTELKREFLRMASYIDVLLECSDIQKEILIGYVSRLAEFMPWTERD